MSWITCSRRQFRLAARQQTVWCKCKSSLKCILMFFCGLLMRIKTIFGHTSYCSPLITAWQCIVIFMRIVLGIYIYWELWTRDSCLLLLVLKETVQTKRFFRGRKRKYGGGCEALLFTFVISAPSGFGACCVLTKVSRNTRKSGKGNGEFCVKRVMLAFPRVKI